MKMTEDREYITDENLYSTGQKVPSEEFRKNWDNIKWKDVETKRRRFAKNSQGTDRINETAYSLYMCRCGRGSVLGEQVHA